MTGECACDARRPGATHEYLESCDNYLPYAGI
jgi:hypothetical protein